ncbi:MAG TPA: hypothetical protein DDY98_03460 [Ruminococcaceae bacterium]|nr:hypothetical protein [Oscillospiraceae bacterium]
MKSFTMKITAVLLTAAVFLCVTSCSFGGKTEEETTEPTSASATVLPREDAEILNYFNRVFAAAKEGEAKLNYSCSYKPKGFETEDKGLASMLKIVAKKMNFGDLGCEVAYGESHSAVMPLKDSNQPLVLTADDVLKIEINRDEFAKQAEEASKLAKDKEYETEAVNVDPDVRRVYIELKEETDPTAGNSLFGRIFALPDRTAIEEELKKASDYLTYDGSYQAKYTGCTIYMEIDRVTDQVIKVEFNRSIEVTATVTGAGTLESVGTQELKFRVEGSDCYELDWTQPAAE